MSAAAACWAAVVVDKFAHVIKAAGIKPEG